MLEKVITKVSCVSFKTPKYKILFYFRGFKGVIYEGGVRTPGNYSKLLYRGGKFGLNVGIKVF